MAQPMFDLEAVIKRRGFIWPSFEIYGGTAGFYDYGPLGTALKNNIIRVWRERFVQRQGFSEIDTPNLTPLEVFISSGHLEKFNDLMLECSECSTLFKAEGLIADYHPDIAGELSIESMEPDSLAELVDDRHVICPDCRGEFKSPYEFNLMFRTTIGRDRTAYLHPETAQGIFVNFQNLYSFHREKLPFGTAQVGKGFRNEISPRQGVLRMREFAMAEAEVFIDPEEPGYPGFDTVRDTEITLLDQHGAFHVTTVGEAVTGGIIWHNALAYFMAATQVFLLEIGIDPGRLRFRQHRQDEMAHYAEDCWDAEIQMEMNGKESWIECVGIANRSCYDLEQHMNATGEDLRAFRKLEEPVEREVERMRPDLPLIGRTFRQDAGVVKDHLLSLEPPFPDPITMELGGEMVEIPFGMYSMERVMEKITGIRFVPGVIEPSFGIDRILYAILQHGFDVGKSRDGVDSESYNVLRLRHSIAPVKVGVFPLFNREGMGELASRIHRELLVAGIPCSFDDSGSIGKRYARMDEIGTPYCITIDHTSLEDGTVTIRDRDSTEQVRIHSGSVITTIAGLLTDALQFSELLA